MSSLAGALISPGITPNVDTKPKHSDEDEEMTDLFGADAEVERPTRNDRQVSLGDTTDGSERLGSAEAEQRRALEYEEEDEIPPDLAIEEREANVAFPNLPKPSSSDKDYWVIRLPNFVKMDSKPFHPDTYIGPEHEEDDTVQQGETLREKSMTIKLKVENTIRWKWIKDEFSGDRRQSNSRIIRWSDGTLSLRLGKELFDITQDIDTSGAVPRKTLGGSQSQQSQSQSQSQPPPPTPGKSHGLTYLVAQHKRSQVLQSEAVITGYMSLRPTGMQSETHRMLVRAVGQKHNKVARLRMAPDPTMDPEKEMAALMKTAKKSTKRRSATSLEWGGTGRSRKSYNKRAGDFSDEEHFDGDEEGGMSARKKRNRDDEDNGSGRYQNDGFVVEDESDDDADFDEDRRKRRRGEEDEDPLDKLEAKIQRQEKKRRHGSEEESEAGEEEPMEVESEEEEEQKVRRAGGSRRRAALYDDEED